ncbi:MAG TPA: DUF86 domain-containing protein [Candidatus Kapabacteria bacterium]|jgi:uncharacterized protein with HEPN domain|nr:DUF86 domain-containing protein [Candidatus Kapabacteria bacterium]
MLQEDKERLQHILFAESSIQRVLGDMTLQDFYESELHTNTVIRYLGVIGEAASRISDELKEAHPEVPWYKIVGMRNRLVHDYYDIDLDAVWGAATVSLPILRKQLAALL